MTHQTKSPPHPALAQFSADLRVLRRQAGKPSFKELQAKTNYGRTALSQALNGSAMPTWPVTEALTKALGADPEEWRQRWATTEAAINGEGGFVDSSEPQAQPIQPRSMAPRPVPAQLPADVHAFIGRHTELSNLDHLLSNTERNDADSSAIVISALSGTAGVGKTALAIRWAHGNRNKFPDGQLFVDLRGYDREQPVFPSDALAGFLQALGMATQAIPANLDERAAAYRTLLDGRRVVVLLDNAASAEQIRPLLPGAPSCMVVVTSRDSLTGLVARHGAHRIDLDLLPAADCIALLHTLIGSRVDAELDAAAILVEQCARLPLALRIAAELANSRPSTTLGDLVQELADEQRRLDLLDARGDPRTAVRAVFSWSYSSLSNEAARVFRLLGLAPGPDISVAAAAALVGTSSRAVTKSLSALVGVHLLEKNLTGRYQFHDLLRLYAIERAQTDDSEELRAKSLSNILQWYLHTANAADQTLMPQRHRPQPEPINEQNVLEISEFHSYKEALEWCESERPSIVAAVQLAASIGKDRLAWQLPAALWSFFYLRKYWDDQIDIYRIGLDSARKINDEAGEAWMTGSLALSYYDTNQFNEAISHATRSLDICRRSGDRWGEGIGYIILSETNLALKQFHDVITYSTNGLGIFERIGDKWSQGICLTALGRAHQGLCHFDEAISYYTKALALREKIGDQWGIGFTLHSIGETYFDQEQFDLAVDSYEKSLATRRRIGDRQGQAWVLQSLGVTLNHIGAKDVAREKLQESFSILDELDDPRSADVLKILNTVDGDSTQ